MDLGTPLTDGLANRGSNCHHVPACPLRPLRQRLALLMLPLFGSLCCLGLLTFLPLPEHLEREDELYGGYGVELLESAGLSKGDGKVLGALRDAASSNPLYRLFNGFGHDGISRSLRYLDSGKLVPVDSKPEHSGSGSPTPSLYDPTGHCPLLTRSDRMRAAREVGGHIQQLFQAQAEARAWIWRGGQSRPLNPAVDADLKLQHVLRLPFAPTWDRVANALAVFAMLPAFVLTDGGNRTTFFNNVARSGCWQPTPFYYGPMVFKFSEVLPRLTDPQQARGFYAATAPESSKYFDRTMLIFLDGEPHRKMRELLNHAGFARRYPIDVDLVRGISARGDDMDSVIEATAPVLFQGLWGTQPSADVMGAIKTYGTYGKFAIFGKRIDEILSPAGITQKIADARRAMRDWAAKSHFVQVLLAARSDLYPGDSQFYDSVRLLQDVVDLSAFAGLLGTTDMVQKCVVNQHRDPGHVQLFSADPEKYLIELMRLDSAVTSVTELLRKDSQYTLEGRNLTLGVGTPVQLVLATANRDPVHFTGPEQFNPLRENLGDSVAWNGRAQDVEARDEDRAPRGCPGYCLSIKVAAAVCSKMMGSFEDLLAQKKVGGEIRCNNFNHENGKRDDTPLWQPPAGQHFTPPTDQNLSLGAVLVSKDSFCDGPSVFLGTFHTVERCTEAVEWAGGKYFVFGKGLIRAGWCYLVYTTSSACPEGIKSSSYDFYSISTIQDSDWLKCSVDLVRVDIVDKHTGNSTAFGLLHKDQYTDPKSVTLLSTVEKRSGGLLLHRPQFCQVDHRLECLGRAAKVQLWETCCTLGFFARSCEPSGPLQLAGPAPAPEDASLLWSNQWTNYFTRYVVDPPTRPPLPSVLHPRLHAEVASTSLTLEEVFDRCPSWIKTVLQAFGTFNAASYRYFYRYVPNGAHDHPLAKLLGKTPESSIMDPTVFGTYTMGMVVTAVHLLLKSYGGRRLAPVHRIDVPSRRDFVDRYMAFSFIGSPTHDLDQGESPYLTDGCVFDAFRKFTITDDLDTDRNEWWRILGGDYLNFPHQCPNEMTSCTKKEFIRGVFANYTTRDGDPVYPVQQFNLAELFRRAGHWTDETEHFYAFNHLGAHTLQVALDRPSRGGETAAYVIRTLDIAGLSRRPGFAAPGADMYFSREGLPLMVRTLEGGDVWKHQVDAATWQYWKFHWRSSLYLRVTLIDHLYATHFAVGGMLAAAAREALPPAHGLRRLLTLFTWNTIGVNDDAMHQLIGSRALLHRSTPYHDWQQVIQVAQASVPTLKERYGAFFGSGLAPELSHVPYYEDGQLIVDSLKNLVGNWTQLHTAEWCGADGAVKDKDVMFFVEILGRWRLDPYNVKDDAEWLGLLTPDGAVTCVGLQRFLSVMFFGVTGYHRHVGQIGDVGVDPDFASWSWREGDPSGIPRQHLQMALVVAFTAKIQPKINQDFSFLAQGLPREAEAKGILKSFQTAMASAGKEIDQRNARRAYPYLNMHPGEVECSVAV